MESVTRAKEKLRVGSGEIVKALSATAFAALCLAPHAANHALETTRVETTVAGLPVELGYYPGATRVNGLNQATLYIDESTAGVGIDAEIVGLPRIESVQNAADLISPKRINLYASLADSPREAFTTSGPQLRDATINNATDYLIDRSIPYGLALYGGLTALRLRRKIQLMKGEIPTYELTPTYLAGAAVVALAGSLAVADVSHNQWEATGGTPDGLSRVEALDGTILEGSRIDNPRLEPTLNAAIEYGLRLKDRRQSERDDYLTSATPNLVSALGSLSAPRENERLLVFISDMHAGKAGTELATTMVSTLQEKFGTTNVAHVFNLGDTLYDPGLQGGVLKDQASIIKDGVQVLTPGNHDVGKTKSLASEAGMIIPEGHDTIDSVEVYSVSDPEQTPFLQDSYYPDPAITQQTIADDAYAAITDNPVDLVNFHDPAAVGALVNEPSRTNLTAEGSLTTCDGNDDFKDINAGLISAGHSHDQYPINMECNNDGTWFVVNLQGTGGGAEESPTFNNWSDPDGVPIKTVSFRVFYQNTEYDSITGYADVQVRTDATVDPVIRVDIGTTDGSPFADSEVGSAAQLGGAGIRQQKTDR